MSRLLVQILADAMGLGKTVMSIALTLARPRRGSSDGIEFSKKRKIDQDTMTTSKPKGGTLVVYHHISTWKVKYFLHLQFSFYCFFFFFCYMVPPKAEELMQISTSCTDSLSSHLISRYILYSTSF